MLLILSKVLYFNADGFSRSLKAVKALGKVNRTLASNGITYFLITI